MSRHGARLGSKEGVKLQPVDIEETTIRNDRGENEPILQVWFAMEREVRRARCEYLTAL